MAAIPYPAISHEYTSASNYTFAFVITASNCDSTFTLFHGFYSSDGKWFSDQKEMLLHENRMYERTLWAKTLGFIPREKVRTRTVRLTRNSISSRQFDKQKRKNYVHTLRKGYLCHS